MVEFPAELVLVLQLMLELDEFRGASCEVHEGVVGKASFEVAVAVVESVRMGDVCGVCENGRCVWSL